MIIPQEQLITIVESLSKTYGQDIAHDVAVVLLRRRNPLDNPEHWARSYASCLAQREKVGWRRIKVVVFSEIGFNVKEKLENLPNGVFIEEPSKPSNYLPKGQTGKPVGRRSWLR